MKSTGSTEFQRGPLSGYAHYRAERKNGAWSVRAWLRAAWRQRPALECDGQIVVARHVRFGATFSYGTGDSDRGISVALQLLWLALYLTFDRVIPERFLAYNPGERYPSERVIGIRVFDGSIWLSLWCDPSETHFRKPWTDPRSIKRSPVFHVTDWLLGEMQYQSHPFSEPLSIQIAMPEAFYPATVTLVRRAWQRPRWPWGRIVKHQADIEIPGGIPIPGKGENGWDCGDDAIYSLTTDASTLAESVKAVHDSAMESRRRYASEDWRPS